MIPHATMDVQTLDTNIDSSERIDMSVDTNSLAHIMSVLTNLYSDTILACIREYSTNARDSHIEAGKADVPIEVTTPNRLMPIFTIKDHGVGMSIEDVENVYSKYGSSTKRSSNAFNGMLGLGSKSALTYTSSFTVVATKDGVTNVISVGRNEDGGGYMDVVDSYQSDNPSGVEIQIPVSINDVHNFASKTVEFFKYWPAGTVSIDGKVNTGFDTKGWTQIDTEGRLFFSPESGDWNTWNSNTIVMGGVAYKSPFGTEFHSPRAGFLYFAEVGEVTFSPSRESLLTIEKNRELVSRIVEQVKDSVIRTAHKQIAEMDSVTSAYLQACESFNNLILPVNGRTRSNFITEAPYGGKTLGDFAEVLNEWIAADEGAYHMVAPSTPGERVNYMRANVRFRPGGEDYSVLGCSVFVTGLPEDALENASRRGMIVRGLRHLELDEKNVILVTGNSIPKKVRSILGDTAVILSSEAVREASREALRKTREANGTTRPRKRSVNSADAITGITSDGVLLTENVSIDPSGKGVVYFSRRAYRNGEVIYNYSRFGGVSRFEKFKGLFPDRLFVIVPDSSQKAFKSRHPKALSIAEFKREVSGKNFVDKVKASIPEMSEKSLLKWASSHGSYNHRNSTAFRNCSAMVASGLDVNDDIHTLVARCGQQARLHAEAEKVKESVGEMFRPDVLREFLSSNGDGSVEGVDDVERLLGDLVHKYPLLNAEVEQVNLDHLALYIEAVDSQGVN